MAGSATCVSLARLNREITIAGGGLAGLSLASALRLYEVPVTVLEAGDYPRHRVCGEFISGVSNETLDALGIRHLFETAIEHRSICWFDRGELIHRDHLKEPALGISRYQLDERLVRHAESLEAIVRARTRATPDPREGHVWATGKRARHGDWIGLKAHVRNLPKSADLEMHAGTNGYTGLAGVEDGWTNVCGLFHIDRSLRGDGPSILPAYIEAGGNSGLAAALRDAEWRDGSFSAVAGFKLGRQAPLPGQLALGDAESLIPPFTGNGMSMAFQAAACAIDPLVSWSQDRLPWQDAAAMIRTALRRKFRKRLAIAGLLHPILLENPGRSALRTLSTARLLPFHPMLAMLR
jgi:menaquinone-9 beta-reductase